jgi:hypothetical protein
MRTGHIPEFSSVSVTCFIEANLSVVREDISHMREDMRTANTEISGIKPLLDMLIYSDKWIESAVMFLKGRMFVIKSDGSEGLGFLMLLQNSSLG